MKRKMCSPSSLGKHIMAADFPVTTTAFAPVTWPEAHCVVQVHDAPVWITFKAAPGTSRGIRVEPGQGWR